MDKERYITIKAWRKIGEKIIRMADNNCKGINTNFLTIGKRAIQKTLDDLNGEDGMHLNEVAEHFGVTTVTVRNWLTAADLPNPQRKADEERTYIPFEVFEKLLDFKSSHL